jgi:hypothetical protein
MVSFKDKIKGKTVDFKEVKEAAINGLGDTCKRGGRIVDYKTYVPPTGDGTTVPPGGTGDGITGACCTELETRLDSIIDLLSKYKGGKYSSKVLKTQAATPIEIAFDITQPSPDPSIIGFYDKLDVHNNKTPPANAEVLWVINDGPVDSADPYLYVRSSPDRISFTQEVPIKIGEKWGFEDVYELRVRSPVLGTQYRLTEYNTQLTYVSVAVNTPITVTVDNTTPIDANIVNTPLGVIVDNTTPIGVIVDNTTPISVTTKNRSAFTTQNVTVGLVDQILPSIVIPDGFSLIIRSNPFNTGNARIYVSSSNATVVGSRNTLAAGDDVRLYVTNANLVHVAASIVGQTVDLVVEQ